MAQQRTRWARRLVRRLGLRGRGPAVFAVVALVLVLGMVGGLRAYALYEPTQLIRSSGEVATLGEEGKGQTDGTSEPGESEENALEESPEAETAVVHVDGAVAAPGLYRVEGAPARVGDAVDLAGGLLDDADTTAVNLAAPVADGQKIYVPHKGEQGEPVQTAWASGASVASGGDAVNINVAGADELMSLPGVGEATARAIIEERERGGPFASPEDIMRVPGIGEKKFERMRGQIVV